MDRHIPSYVHAVASSHPQAAKRQLEGFIAKHYWIMKVGI